MVGDRCISVHTGVIPDLVTPGGLTIKLESAGLALANDLAITEPREAGHLFGHHNGVVVVSRSRGKRDFTFPFAACLYKLSRYVSGYVEGLGNRSPLRHQTGQFVGSCHPNPLPATPQFGCLWRIPCQHDCTAPILRARTDPVERHSLEKPVMRDRS